MSSAPSTRLKWWLPLLAGAAWLAFFADKTPEGAGSQVVGATAAKRARAVAPAAKAASAPEPLALLQPREAAQVTPAKGWRSLFGGPAWLPPPVTPPPPPAAPAPPPAPGYKFLGKKLEAGVWEVYLLREDNSFIAREGQTLESTWRVGKIMPPTLTLTHVSSGQTQHIAIGEAE